MSPASNRSNEPDSRLSEEEVEKVADYLFGDNGETVFVRRDLAESETAARAYALAHEGLNLMGWEAQVVHMLPIPEHFVVDEDWWIVRYGTPGAVAFWRFRT